MIALIVIVPLFYRPQLPKSIPINTEGQPTIGYTKAAVHVVVFEEPKCSHCKEFTNQIFPEIKKHYIDTNKIRFTVIPVSFLPGSMPVATALLCAYHQDSGYPNDELFFTYMDYIFQHEPPEHSDWANTETLKEIGKKASPAMNLEKLGNCIDQETYRIDIKKNTEYGNKLMGRITTPTVYVNGIMSPSVSYEDISELIDTQLGGHG